MINLVNFEHSYDNGLNIKFKPVQRELNSWYEEMNLLPKMVADSTDRPIYICFSGGIDSEAIIKTFIKNNVPFKVLIVRHTTETNIGDFKFATAFCKNNNIEPIIVDLDPDWFFTEGIKKYINQGYKAVRIFRYFQLFLLETVESLGGCAVIGSGEQVYCNVGGKIHINMDQGHTMSLDWCRNNNVTHYPYYLMYNSEVYASYMKLDLIDFLLQRPSYFTNHKDNMSTEKIMIYHRYWPEMLRRNKLHGYEKMMMLKNKVESELRAKFPEIVPTFFPISKIKQELNYE